MSVKQHATDLNYALPLPLHSMLGLFDSHVAESQAGYAMDALSSSCRNSVDAKRRRWQPAPHALTRRDAGALTSLTAPRRRCTRPPGEQPGGKARGHPEGWPPGVRQLSCCLRLAPY
jgi:hypothetical protein